jgi:hypothetical protein
LGCDPRQRQGIFPVSLCVQSGSGGHPVSYPMGTGVHFLGGKARQGRNADHSPHLVPRPRMSRSYTSSPLKRPHGVYWDCFSLLLKYFILLLTSTFYSYEIMPGPRHSKVSRVSLNDTCVIGSQSPLYNMYYFLVPKDTVSFRNVEV